MHRTRQVEDQQTTSEYTDSVCLDIEERQDNKIKAEQVRIPIAANLTRSAK